MQAQPGIEIRGDGWGAKIEGAREEEEDIRGDGWGAKTEGAGVEEEMSGTETAFERESKVESSGWTAGSSLVSSRRLSPTNSNHGQGASPGW